MFSVNWKTAPKINIKTYANDTVCIHSINSITNSYSWKHIFSVHTSVLVNFSEMSRDYNWKICNVFLFFIIIIIIITILFILLGSLNILKQILLEIFKIMKPFLKLSEHFYSYFVSYLPQLLVSCFYKVSFCFTLNCISVQ